MVFANRISRSLLESISASWGRLRLVVTREGETDVMTLKAECTSPGEPLRGDLASTLRTVTKLQGTVDLVAPGNLPNDGKVIADERRV